MGGTNGAMNEGAPVPPVPDATNKPVVNQLIQDTMVMRFVPGTVPDPNNAGKVHIDIRKSFIANNRLGQLSFQVSLKG